MVTTPAATDSSAGTHTPLTTVLAIVVSTPMLVHFLEPIHAATLLGGLVSFVATCANAYRAQGPTK